MVLKEFGRNLQWHERDTAPVFASDSTHIRIEDLSYTSLNTENTWMKIIVFDILLLSSPVPWQFRTIIIKALI
jgi:hypothetical protein